MKYAIIGGTGFEDPFNSAEEIQIETPYGEVKVLLPEGKNFYFLSRHGKNHSISPSAINYRANIWALKKLGVEYIYALYAVGSLFEEIKPGNIVLLTDFIDFTKNRIQTYFDGDKLPLKHLEMTSPYSPSLNTLFEKYYPNAISKGIYIATEGPRFETAAEIRFFKQIGGDVVGMTSVPEVVLARELEIEIAGICTVTNYCTGLVEYVNEEIIQSAKLSSSNNILETISKIYSENISIEKRNYNNFC